MTLVLAVSCADKREPPPAFDGERAYRYLVSQVDLGPRVPGSRASAECRDFFSNHFVALNAHIDSQVFAFFDPYSQTDIPLINFIAQFTGTGEAAETIVLMAHYDSRPRTDYASDSTLKDDPIDGANDGASGVAVLMELGNLFARKAPPCNVDLVLVDGEDWGKPRDLDYYLLGSREFARRGIRGKYRFGIVVDMIGDSSQELYREGYSERSCRALNDAIWRAAARLGITTFRDTIKYTIIDDHLSLISAGVPAIDIIDFDYPYWHTEFDTSDKCSPAALVNVGRVLAEIIYNPSLWPEK
jgi:glutaminyl-peptide cyclotransferase